MRAFVHEQNLTRFIDRIEGEADPSQRERLQDLLLEEEDRFAEGRERLRQAEVLIGRAQARVRQQELLLGKLISDGHDTSAAERVLENMAHLLKLFEDYCDSVSASLERSHPSRLL